MYPSRVIAVSGAVGPTTPYCNFGAESAALEPLDSFKRQYAIGLSAMSNDEYQPGGGVGVGEALELGDGDADEVGVGVLTTLAVAVGVGIDDEVGVAVGVGKLVAVYRATKFAISAEPQPVAWS